MGHTSRFVLVVAAIGLAGCGGDDITAEPVVEAAANDVAGSDPGSSDDATAPYGVVTVEQGASLIALDDVTLIDVRTPEEYDEGHIAGAELVDLSSGDFADEIAAYDPNGRYVVYCRSGNRSAQAVAIMAELGFEQVWDMGGIVDWQAAGYPTVG